MGMLADVTLIPDNVSVVLQPHLSKFSFRTNLFSAAEGRAPPAPRRVDTPHTQLQQPKRINPKSKSFLCPTPASGILSHFLWKQEINKQR